MPVLPPGDGGVPVLPPGGDGGVVDNSIRWGVYWVGVLTTAVPSHVPSTVSVYVLPGNILSSVA